MLQRCAHILHIGLLAAMLSCGSGSSVEGDADAEAPDGDDAADSDFIEAGDVPGADGDAVEDEGEDDVPPDPAADPDALDTVDDPLPEDGEDTPMDSDAPDAPATFLVLTVNLKHPLLGLEDARARLQIVADAINARQPDMVALQEVIRPDGEASFAEQLGGLTGYEWFWEFTYRVPMSYDEGIGVLSRWPIVWHESRELPHIDLVLFRRRVLGARLATPHGDVQMFCSHMTTDSDPTVEADQALAVFRFITDNPSPLPGFFAGDLNAEPDTLAMRFFRGEAGHEDVTGNLADSWMTVNPDDPGYTMSSSDPARRIDYIYMIPGTEQTAEVVSCELMFTEPVGGRYASDHLGVLCLFSLPDA
ncbi:MAG: endonuclease/exonuclease/phosphatase family protein [Pseudomonadota bacterium]